MKILTLPLKKKWFDLIKAGIKKEEYRECSDYWISRFKFVGSHPNCIGERRVMISCDHLNCDRLVFTLGYPKAGDTERRLEFRNPKIRIDEGKPEWGAEPNKLYFVITWEA